VAWRLARLAPSLEAEHAPIEGLMLRANRGQDEIGVEIFRSQPRGAQGDIGRLRKASRIFEPRGKPRHFDDRAARLEVRRDHIGEHIERGESYLLAGGDVD